MLGKIVALVVPVRRDLTAEANLDHVLIAGDQPAFGCGTPVVGDLGLLSVLELLLEDPKLIADGVAGTLQTEGGHAVHIAGGKTAETAVAEAGVGLCLEDIGSIEAEILQRAGQLVADAEVVGVLHQAAAHQELHGHIVDFLLNTVRIFDREETAHKLTDDDRRSLKNLILRRVGRGDAEMRTELVCNGTADLITGNLTNHIKTSNNESKLVRQSLNTTKI